MLLHPALEGLFQFVSFIWPGPLYCSYIFWYQRDVNKMGPPYRMLFRGQTRINKLCHSKLEKQQIAWWQSSIHINKFVDQHYGSSYQIVVSGPTSTSGVIPNLQRGSRQLYPPYPSIYHRDQLRIKLVVHFVYFPVTYLMMFILARKEWKSLIELLKWGTFPPFSLKSQGRTKSYICHFFERI